MLLIVYFIRVDRLEGGFLCGIVFLGDYCGFLSFY